MSFAPVRFISATSLAVALLITGSVATSVPAEAAPRAKKCAVSVSKKNPKQYTTTSVNVSKVAKKARVSVSAKYKTTTNTKRATANSRGKATVKYNVSGATPNRKVIVKVVATKGKSRWECSTSFTPRRR